jgi:hypothetical protein
VTSAEWEYKTEWINWDAIQKVINQWGREGWEVVAVTSWGDCEQVFVTAKRPRKGY